jgi:hypothetical protein
VVKCCCDVSVESPRQLGPPLGPCPLPLPSRALLYATLPVSHESAVRQAVQLRPGTFLL